MRRRAGFGERFWDRLFGAGFERRRQLIQQARDVVVERRDIEVPRRRQLSHLQSPIDEQRVAILFDQLGQSLQGIQGHLLAPPRWVHRDAGWRARAAGRSSGRGAWAARRSMRSVADADREHGFAPRRRLPKSSMKFSEFHAGLVIEAGPYAVSEAELLAFATAYDPQWFHTDIDAAASGRFGGLIASGWHTCGIAMRLAADAALQGSESFASPGLSYVRWTHPVRPGDSLSLRAIVIETRRARSQPTLGILRWRWQLFNQHAVEVLDLEATSLFDLTGAG